MRKFLADWGLTIVVAVLSVAFFLLGWIDEFGNPGFGGPIGP